MTHIYLLIRQRPLEVDNKNDRSKGGSQLTCREEVTVARMVTESHVHHIIVNEYFDVTPKMVMVRVRGWGGL